MSGVLKFFADNLDKIWTLVATLIGAFISYIATTSSEKRKEKREEQREKLKDILIPLCGTVEEALDAMNQYKTIEYTDLDKKLHAPSDFLKAEKRVYLTKDQRTKLQEYDGALQDFYKTWDKEQKAVMQKYINWMAEKLRDFPQAPSAMYVTLDLKCESEDMQKDILEKNVKSYKYDLHSVTYIINDDPDNYRTVEFTFNDEVKNLCGEMEYGISTIDDIDDPKIQISCIAYDYVCGLDDKALVEIIISETKTNDKLFLLAAKAKQLQECLLKDIDKIAR